MITVSVDGGARGNPGPAGFGVQVTGEDGAVVAELKGAIGVATNNVAEYQGLIAALQWAVDQRESRVHVRSDSLLMVQQMRGVYKVKHPNLQPLHQEARRLSGRVGHVTFEHVPRELNRAADRLANAAMDEAAAG